MLICPGSRRIWNQRKILVLEDVSGFFLIRFGYEQLRIFRDFHGFASTNVETREVSNYDRNRQNRFFFISAHAFWCRIWCKFWFCHQTLSEIVIWLSTGRSKSKRTMKVPEKRNITYWNDRNVCQNCSFFIISRCTQMQNSMENLILLSSVTWINDLTALRTVKVKNEHLMSTG